MYKLNLALNPPIPEIGKVYEGTVVGTTKFGAFVNILPGRDGLVHISKMGNGQRINNVEDVMNVGDIFDVRVDDMDDRGKVSLTPVGDGFENNDEGDSGEPRESRDSESKAPGNRETRTRTRGNSSSDSDSEPKSSRSKASNDEDRDFASFSDFLDVEMKEKYGDLGPEEPRRPRNDNKRRNNNNNRR